MNTITLEGTNISITYNQLLVALKQLPQKKRLNILHKFDDEYYNEKFKKLLKELRAKNDDISLEEITKEVEIVRQKRYAEK